MAKNSKEVQARADAKRAGRTRNFATVVYPESAPADWMERLDQCHVAALVSPLHDRDTNPSGEPKKPHYHVLLMFEVQRTMRARLPPYSLKSALWGARRSIQPGGMPDTYATSITPRKPNTAPLRCVVWAGELLFRHEPANR